MYTILGLSLEAGAIYTACTALGEFFYHTNVRTPRWIGYIFQRPEMHRIHHQHGRHKNNYGDIVSALVLPAPSSAAASEAAAAVIDTHANRDRRLFMRRV